MAQPFPPQGEQKQYTERPMKVYGEQCVAGGALPIGVSYSLPTGEAVPPFVISAAGIYQPVRPGDWVISNRYNGQPIEVISDDEFQERFGGGGGPGLDLQPA